MGSSVYAGNPDTQPPAPLVFDKDRDPVYDASGAGFFGWRLGPGNRSTMVALDVTASSCGGCWNTGGSILQETHTTVNLTKTSNWQKTTVKYTGFEPNIISGYSNGHHTIFGHKCSPIIPSVQYHSQCTWLPYVQDSHSLYLAPCNKLVLSHTYLISTELDKSARQVLNTNSQVPSGHATTNMTGSLYKLSLQSEMTGTSSTKICSCSGKTKPARIDTHPMSLRQVSTGPHHQIQRS